MKFVPEEKEREREKERENDGILIKVSGGR